MFEILKNNKRLLAIHIVATVVFVGVVITCVVWNRIDRNAGGLIGDVDTCQSNLDKLNNQKLTCENEKNELASSTDSLIKQLGDRINEMDELADKSLYTCIENYSAHEANDILPLELSNSTDTIKKVDYIVKNNLYVVACNRLWHGRNLLSVLWENHTCLYREAFRYDNGEILQIVLGHDCGKYGIGSYVEINKRTDANKVVELPIFLSGDENRVSPDKKYYVVDDNNTTSTLVIPDYTEKIHIYDWRNNKIIYTETLRTKETASTDCEYAGREDVPYYGGIIVKWLDAHNLEVTTHIYRFEGEHDNTCDTGRTFTIKI